jgi:hypothetical protein
MNCIAQVDDIVLIKHIGASDKPIPTIIIYPKNVDDSVCLKSVLTASDSDAYNKKILTDANWASVFVDALKEVNMQKVGKDAVMLDLFEITCYQSKNCKKKSVILDRRESLNFFESIIKVIRKAENNKNTNLFESLEYLIRRINSNH